jgi:hypothetical protein
MTDAEMETLFIVMVVICFVAIAYWSYPLFKSAINEVVQWWRDDSVKSNRIVPDAVGQKYGGANTVKNVLLVDVANMYVGWYMEKNNKRKMPYMNQNELMNGYIECMQDHNRAFRKKNGYDSAVNYVIKNYKYGGHKGVMDAPKISDRTWNDLHNFADNTRSHVIVAEDYSKHFPQKWKNSRLHYLRGRDDYMLFRMARFYKRKFVNTAIMSDDNFKDFSNFGFVPPFVASVIGPEKDRVYESVVPRPNDLGQLRDYKMVKITLEFSFTDPKFVKSSTYKIPVPGEVWRHAGKPNKQIRRRARR